MTLTTAVNTAMWLVGLAGIGIALFQASRLLAARSGSHTNGRTIFDGLRHQLVLEGGNLCLRVNLERKGSAAEIQQLLLALEKRVASQETMKSGLIGLRDEIELLKQGENHLEKMVRDATVGPSVANG